MLKEFGAVALLQFHDDMLGSATWPAQPTATVASEIWRWVESNHRFNCLLWDEQDKARCADIAPGELLAGKRLIDHHNQMRGDAVERIDEELLARVGAVPVLPDARMSSETAGAMIDRLSILSLKIAAMRYQTRRDDADAQHIAACMVKLMRLEGQRHDLACCLDQLLHDLIAGRAYFKVYRQFKLYNDPRCNPYLTGRPAAPAQTGAGQ